MKGTQFIPPAASALLRLRGCWPHLGGSYLEAAGVTVDVEVLDGDLGVVAHQLSAVGADARGRSAGGDAERP